MEDQSYIVLKSILPEEWAIHEYRPDYGIDLAAEIFKYVDGSRDAADTLGELFFIQLKSVKETKIKKIRVYSRGNVEQTSSPSGSGESQQIEVIPFVIDTDELLTVQTMGPTIAVILCLVCLDSRRIFFVCLNDLIEKVVLIDDPDYAGKKKKTIYIPVKNELKNEPNNLVPLRFYAKRPKFYAAFNKFHYQENELWYLLGFGKLGIHTYREEIDRRDPGTELRRLLSRFIDILKGLDIWTNTDMWTIVGHYHSKLLNFESMLADQAVTTEQIAQNALLLWNGLTALSRNYEELCREWFLPTLLAQYLS
jgi:hypothetical protein